LQGSATSAAGTSATGITGGARPLILGTGQALTHKGSRRLRTRKSQGWIRFGCPPPCRHRTGLCCDRFAMLAPSRLLRKLPFRNELEHLAPASRTPGGTDAKLRASRTPGRHQAGCAAVPRVCGNLSTAGLEPTQDQQAEAHRHPVEKISIRLEPRVWVGRPARWTTAGVLRPASRRNSFGRVGVDRIYGSWPGGRSVE